MTKNDICNSLAIRNDLTKSEAVNAVEGIMEILSEAFCEGKEVYLRGFGTFQIRMTKPRTTRDISRGREVRVPAHRAVKFKPCQTLKTNMQK